MTRKRNYYKFFLKALCSLLILEFFCYLAFTFYLEERFNFENIQKYNLTEWQKTKIIELTNDSMDFRNYDALLGWKNRPNEKISHEEEDGNKVVTYSINSSGLRGTREYSKGKRSGTVRVLALGDSFVFGSEVDDSQCWPKVMEGYSANLEVLNAGVAGYGLDQSLLSFSRLGKEWDPDKVIICYMTMLMQRHVVAFQSFGSVRSIPCTKPRFLLEGNDMVLAPNPFQLKEDYLTLLSDSEKIMPSLGENDYFFIKENGRVLDGFGNFPKLLSLVANQFFSGGNVEEFYEGGYYNTDCEAFRVTDKLLKRFVDEVKKSGADPIVIIFPTRTDLTRMAEVKGYKVYDPLLQSFDRDGIPYLDMASTFEGMDVDELFEKHGHYSPLGNRLVANRLLGELESDLQR